MKALPIVLLSFALVACGGRTNAPDAPLGPAADTSEPPGRALPVWDWADSTVALAHPRSLAPEIDAQHYDIRLTVDAETHEFSGTIVLHARPLVEGLACAAVHADPTLEVSSAVLLDASELRGETLTITRDGDVLRACAEAPLAEAFAIEFAFSGSAGERDHYGLFTTHSDASDLPFFYTQFESQGARLALPLVDEPYDKATTSVRLTGDVRYTLLSNGDPLGCTSENPGWKTCSWHNEEPISPYLITFVAAELEELEATYEREDGSSVPLTVYTEPGHVADALYAMYALQDSLALYEDVYGLPYPWRRYGIVALPGFRYGGMENKGLTNITASAVYFEPGTTPLERRHAIFGVTAHELAHEWFGNLVTMQWWDDVWLNEGFASYMTGLAADQEFDPVARDLGDHVGLQRWYMDVERGPFAHPIVYEDWSTPEQLFDAISYTKGRKVLEMLEALLGRDVLFAGIRRYLTENAGSNAATATFFDTVADEAGADLSDFVDAWLLRAGFPEITFHTEVRDDGVFVLHASQQSSRGPEDDTVWVLPMRIGLEGEGYAIDEWIVIDEPVEAFEFDLSLAPSVVSLNRGATALTDLSVEGWTWRDWAALALADSSAYGRGFALYEQLEMIAQEWERDSDAVQRDIQEIVVPIRGAIAGESEAVRDFALSRITDAELPPGLSDALCAEVYGDLVELLRQPDPGDDVLAVGARAAAISALGRVDQMTTQQLLRELADERVDYVVPAVGAYLRTSADDRWDVHEQALRSWAGNDIVARDLLGALAAVPDAAVLELLAGYLADEDLVDPLDHSAPRTVLRSLIGSNADLAYSEQGMAFILGVFENELDRPGTLIRTLRSLQDAAERSPEEQARLATMLDQLAARLAEHGDPEGVSNVVRMLRESLDVE